MTSEPPAADRLLELLSPRALRRRLMWLMIGAAVGLVIGAAVLTVLVIVLTATVGRDIDPAAASARLVFITLSVVFIGASCGGLVWILQMGRSGAIPFGLGSDAARRIGLAINRGEGELTPDETATAARLAAAGTATLPWQLLQTTLLMVGISLTQLSVFWTESGPGLVAIIFVAVIAIFLLAIGAFYRVRLRRLRAFAARHPYPASVARPLPSGPDQS